MRYLTITFLFLSLELNAQIITGKIVDYETNSGIEYAHIINPETFRGTISDSNGFFEINQEKNINKLIVSCIGYKDTVLLINEINEINENLIKLRRTYIQIEEVSVYGKKLEEKYFGLNKRRPNEVSFSNGGKTDLGWTIYFPFNETGIVKSFGIHILKISNSDIKLRLRFLEPDTTFKTLGFDKLMYEIEIDRLENGWNEIKMNDNNIRISESGLIVKVYFVGIEPNDSIIISGSSKPNDYNWVSSLDYTKDFPLIIRNRKIKPAVKMLIIKY